MSSTMPFSWQSDASSHSALRGTAPPRGVAIVVDFVVHTGGSTLRINIIYMQTEHVKTLSKIIYNLTN